MSSIFSKASQILDYYQSNNIGKALSMCDEALPEMAAFADIMHIRGVIALASGQTGLAIDCLNRAIALNPNKSKMYAHLGMAHLAEGRFQEATANCKKSLDSNPNDHDAEQLRSALDQYRIPPIFLNTLPKSGSVHLWALLGLGLGIERFRIAQGYFPVDLLIQERVARLAQGNCITQEHLPAINRNLIVLYQHGIHKIVVHVRDPRQSLLSLIHHLEKIRADGSFEGTDHPLCDNYFSLSLEEQINCDRYFSLSLEEKIDRHIEHYLPFQIQWIKDWLDVSERASAYFTILFTRFEDMLLDKERFINSILEFHNIDPSRYKDPNFDPQKGAHFRKGKAGEWKTVFSGRQAEKATGLIPKKLLDRFNWPS